MKQVTERLVDVTNKNATVLHVFPVTLEGEAPANDEYEAKALTAAALAQLVPDAKLKDLTAKIHVDREGPLTAYGDSRSINCETKAGLEQIVRERAYFMWEEAGGPFGYADEFWYRAHDQRLQERAYVIWQQEGRPEGQAEAHWHRVCEFEAI